MASFFKTTGPIIDAKSLRILPYPVWLPYSVEHPVAFYLSLFHHMIAATALALMYVAIDGFYIGLLSNLLYQMEILKFSFLKCGTINKKDSGNENKSAFLINMRKLQSIYR